MNDETETEKTVTETAQDNAETTELPNPVTDEVVLPLTVQWQKRDPDTPVFNETMDELADQLPSFDTTGGSPADAPASDDDRDGGEQD
ncbi:MULTISPECIES: hypothetical protein [Amycolatopsis]|uniref:Uncharacterized protein n=2 Tax=Amycolatopsis TaxID=1813 RepID=A0A229S483_9PSEU|nr:MULTISPECIES: hypothetical protein [Amycolatopsis]AXB41270.1 hypothetical protein A4R43_01020 [Amycolatopsis albispora]OXM53737.1 hypothetical protein CFP71_21230 [Amycolatopsis thailandensis]